MASLRILVSFGISVITYSISAFLFVWLASKNYDAMAIVSAVNVAMYTSVFIFLGYFLKKWPAIYFSIFIVVSITAIYFFQITTPRYNFDTIAYILSPVISILIAFIYFKHDTRSLIVFCFSVFTFFLLVHLYFKKDNSLFDQRVCLSLSEELPMLKDFANERNISFSVSDSNECIIFSNIDEDISNSIDEALNKIAQKRPPYGRSDTWGGRNDQKIRLLRDAGISVWTAKYDGVEFIVWSDDDAERAEEILGYPQWMRSKFKEARDAAD